MKEDILKAKSFAFAVRIVKLYKYLCEQKTEYDSLSADAVEIIKILTTSIKTVKNISH